LSLERKEIWYIVEAKDLDKEIMGVSHVFCVQTYPRQRANEDQRTVQEIENASAEAGYELSYVGGLTYLMPRSQLQIINNCVLFALRRLHRAVHSLRDIDVNVVTRMIKYGEANP
jgi:hypothetical protein